jgi:uncharacterized membrane protein YccC
VAERFAQLLEAYREYFHALVENYVAGSRESEQELERAQLGARVARSNLEGSVERLASEPGSSVQQMSGLNAMLASSHRFVHALMAVHAGWLQSGRVPARPPFRKFAEDVEKTLSLLTGALRGQCVADKDFPNLREDHNRLLESGEGPGERYALVNVEADRITNSVNTLREQILGWVRGPAKNG